MYKINYVLVIEVIQVILQHTQKCKYITTVNRSHIPEVTLKPILKVHLTCRGAGFTAECCEKGNIGLYCVYLRAKNAPAHT